MERRRGGKNEPTSSTTSAGGYRPGVPASSQAPRGPFALLAGLRRELAVPLFRNAYALMLNTVVNSGLGLLYWMVAARTFPDAAVGRGSALVSLMVLVSTLTQLNCAGARPVPAAGGPLGAADARRRRTGWRPARGVLRHGRGDGLLPLRARAPATRCGSRAGSRRGSSCRRRRGRCSTCRTRRSPGCGLGDMGAAGERAVRAGQARAAGGGGAHVAVRGVFASWTLPVIALIVPVNLLIFRRILPRHASAAGQARRGAARRRHAAPLHGRRLRRAARSASSPRRSCRCWS